MPVEPHCSFSVSPQQVSPHFTGEKTEAQRNATSGCWVLPITLTALGPEKPEVKAFRGRHTGPKLPAGWETRAHLPAVRRHEPQAEGRPGGEAQGDLGGSGPRPGVAVVLSPGDVQLPQWWGEGGL